MFKDIIVVDNVFDDPDSVVEFAKKQTFYTREHHPTESTSKWIGSRTMNVGDIDERIFNHYASQILVKSVEKTFGKITPFKLDANWNTNMFFHQLTNEYKFDNSWLHTDEASQFYAGVVYLRRNPEKNSGTIVFINDRPVEVENVFNRLVLYRSDYVHTTQGGFGETIDDSRLTMNLFFKQLTISIKG